MVAMLHTPIVAGAITGLTSAVLVDLHAWAKMSSWSDLKSYNWNTATFRWFIGIVSGGVMGAGLGAI